MMLFRILYLAVGLSLLGWIVADADLATVWDHTISVGIAGIAVILGLYALEFLADVALWQVTFRTLQFRPVWTGRLYVVRMVGEAFNAVTPMASMGGEPVKVLLLKKYYGISYGETSASVLLAKTTNLIALVIFLAGGFVLLAWDARFSAAYKSAAAAGLAGFAVVIAAFFLVQRLRVSSRLSAWMSRWRFGSRVADALHHIEAFDDHLVEFYVDLRRFPAAGLLALVNWFIGVLGIYYTMRFLEAPVTFTEAWIIESFAQLVRAGTFFIPASIGAQEGAFVLVCGVLTGNPAFGLAAALIRRFRELVWISTGLLLGWGFSFRPPRTAPSAALDDPAAATPASGAGPTQSR